MPSVILEELFAEFTPLPAGGYLRVTRVAVAGTVSVCVNVAITNVNGQVRRSVLFSGPHQAVCTLRAWTRWTR